MNGHEHGPDSPHCRALFARLSEYLDEELDPSACERIEEHLGDCSPCRAYLESLRRTVGLARELPPAELPDEVRDGLIEAYRRARDTDV